MRTRVRDRWLRRFRDGEGCTTKLVCFPHAGGWASAYRTWPAGLPADVGVLAVRYPGREDRIGEPSPSSLEALADDVADALDEQAGHRLVLFGHSMGASVAYEVAVRLHQRGRPPVALCVSARLPPKALVDQPRFDATDDEIIAAIVRQDESRTEVFADLELREFALPAIRADLELVNDYRGGPRPALDCPVFGYAGESDAAVGREQMRGWADVTRGPFRLRVFPGGHFYLRTEETRLLTAMAQVCIRGGRYETPG
ncbi:thioesterase II family protein [Couchioplanes caeruleus]|uniref:Pyochelin biosynthetic protein PchC n=1 Tax=Couchioplanes caeruleus TaxID=56438 RepID=A0A3N1GMC5_9ACTN|nr:alpha/beta fold hydrolase [Couchioplanes caeruleus]ROP31331.1 pyochelin biosynthetic protein PchC [Couchioplanes caeruleus]